MSGTSTWGCGAKFSLGASVTLRDVVPLSLVPFHPNVLTGGTEAQHLHWQALQRLRSATSPFVVSPGPGSPPLGDDVHPLQELTQPGAATLFWEGDLPDLSPFLDHFQLLWQPRKRKRYEMGERLMAWLSASWAHRPRGSPNELLSSEPQASVEGVSYLIRSLLLCTLTGAYTHARTYPPWPILQEIYVTLTRNTPSLRWLKHWSSERSPGLVLRICQREYMLSLVSRLPGLKAILEDRGMWKTLQENIQREADVLRNAIACAGIHAWNTFTLNGPSPNVGGLASTGGVDTSSRWEEFIDHMATQATRCHNTHPPASLIIAATAIPRGVLPWSFFQGTLAPEAFSAVHEAALAWEKHHKIHPSIVQRLVSPQGLDQGYFGQWCQALRRAWKITLYQLPLHILLAQRNALWERYGAYGSNGRSREEWCQHDPPEGDASSAGRFYYSPVCGFKGFPVGSKGRHTGSTSAHGSRDILLDAFSGEIFCSHKESKSQRRQAQGSRLSWEMFEDVHEKMAPLRSTVCEGEGECGYLTAGETACTGVPCLLISLLGWALADSRGVLTLCTSCGCPTHLHKGTWHAGLPVCSECSEHHRAAMNLSLRPPPVLTCTLCHSKSQNKEGHLSCIEVYDDLETHDFRKLGVCSFCHRKWTHQEKGLMRYSILRDTLRDRASSSVFSSTSGSLVACKRDTLY